MTVLQSSEVRQSRYCKQPCDVQTNTIVASARRQRRGHDDVHHFEDYLAICKLVYVNVGKIMMTEMDDRVGGKINKGKRERGGAKVLT